MEPASIGPRRANPADTALGVAVKLWFAAMVAGQASFLTFVVAFYGPTIVSGNYAAWDANPFLSDGYVEGDVAGNLAFATHVMFAALILLAGLLQLIPAIRRRAAWLHRWNGRVFLAAAMLVALSGLWLDITREIAKEVLASNFAISLNGLLVLAFGALAWRAAARRDIAAHQRWALRAFVVINGVFFLRMMVFGAIILVQRELPEVVFKAMGYASYLVPLALVEFYIRAKEGGPILRVAAAMVIAAVSAYMALGVVGYTLIFVNRVLGA
jgi:uncharacterized membrane protein